jgi:uncharacterized membrane protein
MFERITTTFQPTPYRGWLVLIVIGGMLLRLINIQTEPFWGDEVLSLAITHHFQHIPTLIQYLSEVEFHPPLFYLALHYWAEWFGYGSRGGIRALSLMFGIGSIVIAYFLGKKIFENRKIGLVAAFLLAILPFHIEFSQEARPYTILCVVAALSMYVVWEYLQGSRKRWLFVYIVCSLIGLYVHYSYAFFLASIGLFWFFDVFRIERSSRHRALFIWFLTHSAIFLGFSFWLVPLLYKIVLSKFSIIGLERNFHPLRPSGFFWNTFDQIIWLSKHQALPHYAIFAKFIAASLFLYTILLGVRKKWFDESLYRNILFLLVLIFVPVVLFFFSNQSIPYTIIYTRHVIYISIPVVLLVAYCIASFPVKTALAVGGVLIISFLPFVIDVVGNDALYDEDFQLEEAAQYIEKLYKPGDIVVIPVAFLRSDFQYYLDTAIPVVALQPYNYFENDFWRSTETLGFIENEYQVRIEQTTRGKIIQKLDRINATYQPKRIWLYAFERKDYAVHDWFVMRNWTQHIASVADIFLVDLYVPNK